MFAQFTVGCESLISDKNKIIAGDSERTFMTGVLWLSLSTVIVKIIGLAYKIPLLSILGAEGMGYFNSAYEIYAMLCIISTSGLPVAISILISGAKERGDVSGVRRIFGVSSCVLVTLGVIGSLALGTLARPIANAIGNPNAYYCILAVSPALLFVCVSGAVRGYFQGHRNMFPTALSQLIEALGKLLFGVSLSAWAMQKGYSVPISAAFAVFGLVIGGFVSTAFLVASKLADNKKYRSEMCSDMPDRKTNISDLLKIAFPITLGAALLGVTKIIDMSLIMRRLQDMGISSLAANEIYGSYTTLAIPVFSLIPALVTPISESLIPRLSAAKETGERYEQRKAVEKSVRLTVLLAMPASMGILLYSEQILDLIFRGQPKAVSTAAPLLSILGASVLFSCLITTTNAILQSYRRVFLPIVSMAVGALVKGISAYVLIGNANIGELGAPISTLICNVTVVGLNIYFVDRSVPEQTATARLLVRPFFASVLSVMLSLAVYLPLIERLGESVAFLSALVFTLVAYFTFAFAFRAVSVDDLSSIPLFDRILNRKFKNKGVKK